MKKRELSTGKTVLSMRALYLLFWGTLFIATQYMAMFLREYSYTDDLTVGLLMSGGSLIATISQICWGKLADHSKSKNRILLITITGVICGLAVLILPNHTSFSVLIPCVFFFYIFSTVPPMLTDTITVENIDKTGIPFGWVRNFASAGACMGALLIFFISLGVTMEPATAMILAAALASLSLFPAYFLPHTQGHAYGLKADKEKTSYKIIFKNRRLMLLVCFLLMMFIGVQACNVFLGVYYATDAGMNAGLGMYGLFFGICIGVETLVMSFGNRLWRTMNIYNVFFLISAAAFARALIVFIAPNIYVLQLLAIFQALLFAPLWTRLTPYVNSIVPKEMRATGQAVWNIVTSGVAPMVGSALGGFIASEFGIRNLFGIISVMLFAVMVVFYFLFKHQRVLDEKEGLSLGDLKMVD